MSCVLFKGKLDESPYKKLFNDDRWKEIYDAVVRACCRLCSVPYRPYLETWYASANDGRCATNSNCNYVACQQVYRHCLRCGSLHLLWMVSWLIGPAWRNFLYVQRRLVLRCGSDNAYSCCRAGGDSNFKRASISQRVLLSSVEGRKHP